MALKVEPKYIVARNNPTEEAEKAEETPKPEEKSKEADA
jgi:ribosomal protein S24E